MRTLAIICAVVGFILTAQAEMLDAGPDKETKTERIARLIRQLGDDTFAKREPASKELDYIGVPALAAPRKAAADSDDAEVRQRAGRIVQAITGRLQEVAAKVEFDKIQGTWIVVSYEGGGQVIRAKD